jgi:hypothetical protein
MVRSTVLARAAVAGAAALALGVLTAAVGAAPAGAQAQPPAQVRSVLMLAVVPHDAPATAAVLSCQPPGGTHPEAEAACRDVAAANGDLTQLPGDPEVEVCPDVWDPVTAVALGWWQGRLTRYTETFGNSCELAASTGPVFALAPANAVPTT